MAGGSGGDHFLFASLATEDTAGTAPYVIADFAPGAGGDVVHVETWLYQATGNTRLNPFALGHLRLRQDGADAVLSWDIDGGGDGYRPVIRLLNTQASALTEANFKPGFRPLGEFVIGTAGADAIRTTAISAGVRGGPLSTLGDTINTAGGDDVVAAGAGADSILGGDGADMLGGGGGDDTLLGAAGNDTLDGGAGLDWLRGGIGDDLYIVAMGDAVIEAANQGIDTVRTALEVYVLSAHVEHLVATGAVAHRFLGNALDNAVTGNAGADVLDGGAGSDTLNGGGGNDTLNGGTGIDWLRGATGDDLYLVTAGDVVVEGANQGIDTVRTTAAAYVLAAHVEHLEAGNAIAHRFTGNALDNTITGGAGADTLLGGIGRDTLDGGMGIDRLFGGTGDDVYIVTAGDVVVETAGQGNDTVLVTQSGSYSLSAHVENAILSGGLAVNAVGNTFANSLLGNGAINVLYGMGGADTLAGEGGNDLLIGGVGADMLLGGRGNDLFRLGAATDSTEAAMDIVADFTFLRSVELDRVDLRLIDANVIIAGNQAFSYRGADFTGAAGDLRVQSLGDGDYAAAGDTNGDSIADFVISIRSQATPEAAWFLL